MLDADVSIRCQDRRAVGEGARENVCIKKTAMRHKGTREGGDGVVINLFFGACGKDQTAEVAMKREAEAEEPGSSPGAKKAKTEEPVADDGAEGSDSGDSSGDGSMRAEGILEELISLFREKKGRDPTEPWINGPII